MSLDDIPEQAFAVNIPGYDPTVRTRGRISTSYDVWCGKCGEWESCGMKSPADAAKKAREMGWKLTRAHGWVCPSNHKRDTATT